jgi:hypothetical protein
LRLDDFHGVVSHSPKAFRQTQSEIPLLVDTLKQTQKAIDAGSVPADTARALSPVVDGCRERLGELESLVVAALPKQNDSTRVRHYKALASIVKESKIEKINRSIHRYIETLTFYHAAAAASKSHTSLGMCDSLVQDIVKRCAHESILMPSLKVYGTSSLYQTDHMRKERSRLLLLTIHFSVTLKLQ